MRRLGGVGLAVLTTVGIFVAPPRDASAVIVANDALDVCGATVNPCIITQTVTVVTGSVLDFGTRTVQVSNNGQIDVGSGTGRVRAGRFVVQVAGTGLKLNDGPLGGLLTVESFRTCSLNPAVRCLTSAACAAANAGVCSGGNGEVVLQGKTLGNAEFAGALVVRAGGDVRIGQRIQISGSTLGSDGGSIDIEAAGALYVDAPVEVNSGGEGTGGEIVLSSGGDLFVNAAVDAQGGDFDGGGIELFAGRDVLITAPISADANTGEGFGGSLEVTAARNIEVVGGAPLNNLFLSTEGHTGYDGATAFAGDGGFQSYFAGGSVAIGPYVKLRANGALPDGSGDEISISADGPVVIRGAIESRARGALGAGGFVDIESLDVVTLASSSTIDVVGGESGAGEVFVTARGDLSVAGAIDASATNGGTGGYLDFDSQQVLTISGSVVSAGQGAGLAVSQFGFSGCRIDVLAGAGIANLSTGGRNTFYVADRLKVFAGASVRAGTGGQNRVQHRDPGVLPQILGVMTPAALISVNTALPTCPLCGNATVNLDETCDDGNVVSGDGCSADCQHEGCIAATPAYPNVPLCSDGNPCTADRCDTIAGTCTHVASCDDGFACTVDACVGSVCVHTPLDDVCDDNNACTSQSCGAGFGCSITPIAGSCDDEIYCNGTDVCLAGACALHSGDPCSGFPECLNVCDESTDRCRAPYGYPCTSDGNVCTDDVCSGVGGCLHAANSVQCDDGIFCDGVDFCVGGSCSLSAGNPCDAGSECAHTCDETANVCSASPGDPCSDDGNECTDDYCDGFGGCEHAANNAPCEDGDFCTVTDVCTGGACSATDRVLLPNARITASRRSGVADDRISVKASAPLADLSTSPVAGGLSISLRDAGGGEIFAAYLPAAGIVDSGGSGATFKFRDTKGVYPTANGVVSATIKRVASAGAARFTLKARGREFPPFDSIDAVALSVLVGVEPSSGDCLSAPVLACSSTATALRCSN